MVGPPALQVQAQSGEKLTLRIPPADIATYLHRLTERSPTIRVFVSYVIKEVMSKQESSRGGAFFLSRCPGLNWRPHPYHGCALPTELHRLGVRQNTRY